VLIDTYTLSEDPLVIFDVRENGQPNSVLAEKKIVTADVAQGRFGFLIDFYAQKDQRLDFSIYWNAQCIIKARHIVLHKLRQESRVQK
jgi:hypothetical protein